MSRAELTRKVGSLRRRMPRHLFSVLSILLLLLGCACGPAYTADGAPVKSVRLFAAGTTKVPAKKGGTVSVREVIYFDSSFLVAGGGVMLAFAEARYSSDPFRGVDILARNIDTEGPDWAAKTTANNGNNWGTQLVLPRKEGGMHETATKRSGAVIKGNKTYLLALTVEGNGRFVLSTRWHLELFVGEIMGGGANKTIKWNQSELLGSTLTQEIESRVLRVFVSGSTSAFLTSKGTMVFSVVAKNKENKWSFAIMQLKDEEQWEVSFLDNSRWCRLVLCEWKEKLIGIVTGCRDGNPYVREYDEVSKEWNDFNGTFFRRGRNLSNTRGFTTASIENRTVLLYTEARFNNSANGQWKIRLWVTDGRRFHDAGVIATEHSEVVSWGLAYANGELFSLHQVAERGLGPIVFTRLDRQLKAIRSKVKLWPVEEVYLAGSSRSRGYLGARW